ncbi:MAG: TonB-dependent receptor [Paludibacteraceae bacterium]|nr:TonB-dependent receptor [Paludibacteraceae bacterium]
MKKIILFSFFIFSFCAILSAQIPASKVTDAHIVGDVTDAHSGDHLPYVNVVIKGTTIGIMTDASGHYFLKNLPIGTFTIIYSMVGYQTVERTITIEPNKTLELKIKLEETSIMMDNIVVTGNKYETKKKETSSIVNVVTPLIFTSTSANSIGEALDYQTGLRTEMTCGNCGVPQLRINGLEGHYSQLLLDSRPLFSSLASVYGLEQMPTGMIDRVEVIRGGASALYGSNAIGGVVNIITKEPTRNFVELSNNTSLLGNSALDANTTFNASIIGNNSNVGVFLFGVLRDRQAYDRDNDGFSEMPALQGSVVGFRSYFKTSNYSKITTEYHHSTEYRRGGDLLDLPAHEANLAEQLQHNIDAGSVKFDLYTKDNKHFISTYSAFQHIVRNSYFGTGQDLDAYGKSKDINSVTGAQYRYSMDNLLFMPADFSMGIEYTYNQLQDQMLGHGIDVNQNVSIFGGYLQNEWKNNQLSLLAGARVEKHNLMNNPVVSPRVSLRYNPTHNIVLRTGYASGYRAPQIYNEDLHVAAVGGEVSIISQDANLRPEYSHSFSVSADAYHRFGFWETNLTVDGFYTKLNDVFALEENGFDSKGNLLLLRVNESGATVTGVNIEGVLGYKNLLSLQLGYTLQSSLYDEPVTWSTNTAIEATRRMQRTPDHYGYAVMNYNATKNFTASVSGKYTGSMLVPHFAGYIAEDTETISSPFWDMGVKLAYKIPFYKYYALEVNGGVKNILDSFQPDLDKGMDKDAGYIYGPTLPRTFFVGLSLKL